jgi:hypothetical protein
MNPAALAVSEAVGTRVADTRVRTANRVFRAALVFNSALTAFWIFALLTHRTGGFFAGYEVTRDVVARIAGGIIFFYVIWGSYIVADALSEAGGALFGKQTLRVRGMGDVNRKSIGGTVSGFVGALVFCLWIVIGQGLPLPWVALAVVISSSNTVIELVAPRGTDDLLMATGNAVICLAFGSLVAS